MSMFTCLLYEVVVPIIICHLRWDLFLLRLLSRYCMIFWMWICHMKTKMMRTPVTEAKIDKSKWLILTPGRQLMSYQRFLATESFYSLLCANQTPQDIMQITARWLRTFQLDNKVAEEHIGWKSSSAALLTGHSTFISSYN